MIWVLDRFAGQEVDADLLGNELLPSDTIAALVDRYRRVWREVDDVLAANELDATVGVADDQANPDLRWVLAHLVQETARHAGHADILRELIDGEVGR